MEFKWFAICVAVLIAGLAVSDAVQEHAQGECRVAAINQGMTSEDIAKVCK